VKPESFNADILLLFRLVRKAGAGRRISLVERGPDTDEAECDKAILAGSLARWRRIGFFCAISVEASSSKHFDTAK